jgi:peptide/nickel transport system permease protein
LFSLLGLSLPNFWLGPLLIIVFSIQLGWTPVSGRGGLDHLLLPSLTLGLGMAAILTRILRGSLLQVINEDYVRTARAKGLGEKKIWLKHTLRNALVSVITIMSLQFGSLLAGSIITETIFSWPGIGRLTVQAIQTRDYPVVQGCVLTIAISYLLVNLLADIFYRLVDPRIVYGK